MHIFCSTSPTLLRSYALLTRNEIKRPVNTCKLGPEIYVYLNLSNYHLSSITSLKDMLSLNDDQVSLKLALALLLILIGIYLLYTKILSLCAISFMIAVPLFELRRFPGLLISLISNQVRNRTTPRFYQRDKHLSIKGDSSLTAISSLTASSVVSSFQFYTINYLDR